MQINTTAGDIAKFFAAIPADTVFDFSMKFKASAELISDPQIIPEEEVLEEVKEIKSHRIARALGSLIGTGLGFEIKDIIAELGEGYSYPLVYSVVTKIMKEQPHLTEYRKEKGSYIPTGVQYIPAKPPKNPLKAVEPKKVAGRRSWYNRFEEEEAV